MIDFDKELNALLQAKKERYPAKLFSAIEYSLFPGGKRIRPRLMFLSADFVEVPQKKVLPLALALELIHSYSLVHDDLPCMDNDDFRRGKPSCHSAFGETTALLAGDALLNLAYETLFSAVKKDADLVEAAQYIAESAGAEGMIAGQAIEYFGEEFTEPEIIDLYQKKTGALIKAAIMAPAFLACEGEKAAALSIYSDAVGLAFQLRDDLLDEDNEEKKSYISVVGKEKTLTMLDKLRKVSAKALSKWEEGKALVAISEWLTERKE